jgi:hypothetical protein
MQMSSKEIRDMPDGCQCSTRSNHCAHLMPLFPYASGQAPRVTVPSAAVVDGHVPSSYGIENLETSAVPIQQWMRLPTAF